MYRVNLKHCWLCGTEVEYESETQCSSGLVSICESCKVDLNEFNKTYRSDEEVKISTPLQTS